MQWKVSRFRKTKGQSELQSEGQSDAYEVLGSSSYEHLVNCGPQSMAGSFCLAAWSRCNWQTNHPVIHRQMIYK